MKKIKVEVEKSLHLPMVDPLRELTLGNWNEVIKHIHKFMKMNKAKRIRKIIINPTDIQIVI